MPGFTVAHLRADSDRMPRRHTRPRYPHPPPPPPPGAAAAAVSWAGRIRFLPPKREITVDCSSIALDEEGYDHPVVILSSSISPDGKVEVLTVTSFQKQDLQDHFREPHKRHLWADYLPIHPSKPHPTDGLILELAPGCEPLRKNSYVNISRRLTIPLDATRRAAVRISDYHWRGRRPSAAAVTAPESDRGGHAGGDLPRERLPAADTPPDIRAVVVVATPDATPGSSGDDGTPGVQLPEPNLRAAPAAAHAEAQRQRQQPPPPRPAVLPFQPARRVPERQPQRQEQRADQPARQQQQRCAAKLRRHVTPRLAAVASSSEGAFCVGPARALSAAGGGGHGDVVLVEEGVHPRVGGADARVLRDGVVRGQGLPAGQGRVGLGRGWSLWGGGGGCQVDQGCTGGETVCFAL
ncbi:uncharacterized protein E0L32_012386 [Thyridium curvatum]|uniref:Uncharacterized protein n=1 Tax=Thyridium curvatum TaxID=1093900 RepID=A0A507B3F0_9PEZI|nr:uncharacterized protein E0L32_012386 [Thyridium curvatum]TPX16782.1 hypothetical protein E0L32_012386 [Thyridium curvatum]